MTTGAGRLWASLRRRMGRRGDALLFFATIDLAQAWTLWSGPQVVSPTYAWFASIMPLDAWAVFWGLAGLTCLYHAFTHDDQFGFVATMGIKVVWALGSLAGWLLNGVTLLGAVIWVIFAAFVWRISGWPEEGHSSEDLAL